MCTVSVSSARLPVSAVPIAWARRIVRVTAKAIAILPRTSGAPGGPAGAACEWSWGGMSRAALGSVGEQVRAEVGALGDGQQRQRHR